MERELALFFTLLKRRTEMLRLLGAALRQSQKALAELDLNGIYQNTLQQETLCTGIRFLDRELQEAQQRTEGLLPNSTSPDGRGLAKQLDPVLMEHLRSLGNELAEAQAEVRHLNRVQAGLLRRSRRSVNVLVNFLANYTETYQSSGYHTVPTLPIAVGA